MVLNEELKRIAERASLKFVKLRGNGILDFEDLILYGSLARDEPAQDIDLMMVRYVSPVDIIESSTKTSDQFIKNLIDKANDDELRKVLTNGILDIRLIDPRFFSNLNYRIDFYMSGNRKDPLFFYNVIRDGLLYNPKTEKFDLKAIQKYDPIIHQSHKARKNASYYF